MSIETRPSGTWLAPLDGLRGISILLVMTAHVYRPGWRELGGPFGVTVFFVLSGFLITHLLLREEKGREGVDLPAFYVRRAFRLFPAYYFVLAVHCFIVLGLGVRPDLKAGFLKCLPWYLVYLQEIPFFWPNPMSEPRPFYQSWSLGIEEKFYFVWPVLAFVLLRGTRWRVVAAVAAVGLFSAAPEIVGAGRYVFPYAAISAGCLLALLYDDRRMRVRLERLVGARRAWATVLAWIGLHCVAATATGFVATTAGLLYPAVVSAVLVASLSSPALGRVLSAKPLTFLGGLSYGIYLIHILVRNAVEASLGKVGVSTRSGVLVYSLMLAASILLAWIMNTYLETPLRLVGRAMARRMGDRRRLNLSAEASRAVGRD